MSAEDIVVYMVCGVLIYVVGLMIASLVFDDWDKHYLLVIGWPVTLIIMSPLIIILLVIGIWKLVKYCGEYVVSIKEFYRETVKRGVQ